MVSIPHLAEGAQEGEDVMYWPRLCDLRNNLRVFMLIAMSGVAFPALATANPASLRSLPIVSSNEGFLVIGMFQIATRPMGRVPCTRNALASNGPWIPADGTSLLGANYAPGPSLALFAFCTEPTNKTCRTNCQSCQLGLDVSLDENSCGGPPSFLCFSAGECLLTTNNRCCIKCTYSCSGSCFGCPAPLRCAFHL